MFFNYKVFKRLYFFLGLITVITIAGMVGYRYLESWSWLDSFYMTIITMSTIGFGEVHPLSVEGKLFTSFLIISSFGTIAYAATSIINFIVAGEYKIYILEYQSLKTIQKMENHVIICGFGRVGRQVAEDLRLYGLPFVVVETDNTRIADCERSEKFQYLIGDATKDETLENANIDQARALICCLPKDAENIYIVLAAREKRSDLEIIARASDLNAVPKIRRAGASRAIMPDAIGGSHMASLITNPGVSDFMNMLKIQGTSGVNIDSITFEDLPERFKNKSLDELQLKHKTGATIIGYKTPDGPYIINPDLSTKLEPNSQLFVLGTTEQIFRLNQLFLQ